MVKTSLRARVTRVLCFIFTIAALLIALDPSLPVFATNTAQSGVSYEVSDDGTYVIITGYDEQFPNLSIESEIGGLPVKEIAESAFQNCTYIYSVTIPDSVEKIGKRAFRDCSNLLSVKLPSGLKEIPFEAFRDCRLLSSVTLPVSLEMLDDFCFQGCTMLGKMKIPSSVTYIGHDAFMDCESIRLDVSENALAADYAERYSVNTDFRGTTLYFALMMLLGSAVAIGLGTVIVIILKRHFAKHPEHDPFIYIKRGLGFLKRKLLILFKALWALLLRFFGFCAEAFKRFIGMIRDKRGKK